MEILKLSYLLFDIDFEFYISFRMERTENNLSHITNDMVDINREKRISAIRKIKEVISGLKIH